MSRGGERIGTEALQQPPLCGRLLNFRRKAGRPGGVRCARVMAKLLRHRDGATLGWRRAAAAWTGGGAPKARSQLLCAALYAVAAGALGAVVGGAAGGGLALAGAAAAVVGSTRP